MVKTIHTVNGKFFGVFYTLSDGRKLYLAHRTPSQIFFQRMAWCIDESTLRKCRAEGIYAVGVALRQNGRSTFYLAHIDDFYGSAKSFSHFGDAAQRGLPLKWFRVNPMTCAKTISRIAGIGRGRS